MKSVKKEIWEDQFSDNFHPNLLENLIKKLEVSRRKVIVDELSSGGDTLLDLACGNGDMLFELASKYKKLVGVDIASNRIKSALNKARELHIKNIQFILADLDSGIPLKTASVDRVVCEASLSYFYNVDSALGEIRRVLKPDGTFIVEVPNYAFITRRIALLAGNLPKTSSFPGLSDGGALHYFTYGSLKEILIKNKFKVVKSTNSGVLPSLRKIYPELMAGDIIYVCKKRK